MQALDKTGKHFCSYLGSRHMPFLKGLWVQQQQVAIAHRSEAVYPSNVVYGCHRLQCTPMLLTFRAFANEYGSSG